MSGSYNHIYTVSALTARLRQTIEERFPFVWVRGEVTGVSRPQSGHLYFGLKDAQAQLQCAWFAGRQRKAGQSFDPLTGEVYEEPPLAPAEMARNGAELLCAGRLDVYAPRGQYQLLVEFAQPAGAGLLALEFEARKARLAALGYFACERKRPLPPHPARIALVTSSRGAAIHDFLEISRNRGVGSRIRLYPVQVQGEGAAEKMAEAIAFANADSWADVIVIIRGGGSMEDLWAFNEECLAKAIFDSELPVLAGIGHEVDVTLADMTADVRAATPSHAAQLLWRPRNELWQNLDSLQLAMTRCLDVRLESAMQALTGRINSLRILSPFNKLERLREKLAGCERRLAREMDLRLAAPLANIAEYERRAQLALRVKVERSLSRVTGCRMRLDRAVPLSIKKARENLRQAACSLEKAHGLRQRLATADARLESGLASLTALFNTAMTGRRFAMNALAARLRALDPAGPLKRGYALLRGREGLVTSVTQVQPGDLVEAELLDGSLDLSVSKTKPHVQALLQGECKDEDSMPS